MLTLMPACPVAGALPGRIEAKVKVIEGVTDAHVKLVWDPPWSRAMISEAAKLQLGLDDPARLRRPFVPESLLARRSQRGTK